LVGRDLIQFQLDTLKLVQNELRSFHNNSSDLPSYHIAILNTLTSLQFMLRYEQKSKISETSSVSIAIMRNVKSYNKCSKCSLSALTQPHNHLATRLLPRNS